MIANNIDADLRDWRYSFYVVPEADKEEQHTGRELTLVCYYGLHDLYVKIYEVREAPAYKNILQLAKFLKEHVHFKSKTIYYEEACNTDDVEIGTVINLELQLNPEPTKDFRLED